MRKLIHWLIGSDTGASLLIGLVVLAMYGATLAPGGLY